MWTSVLYTHVAYLTGLQILWSYHLKKLWMGQWTNLPVIFQPPNLCGSWLNIILMLWTQSWRCGMRHGKFSHLIIVLLGFKYIFSVSSPFQIAYNATPKARRKWKGPKKHILKHGFYFEGYPAGIKWYFCLVTLESSQPKIENIKKHSSLVSIFEMPKRINTPMMLRKISVNLRRFLTIELIIIEEFFQRNEKERG